jgi:hypothetical protein
MSGVKVDKSHGILTHSACGQEVPVDLPYRVPKWWPYQDEFPDWRVWQGMNKLYYARLPGTHPLVIVHGEDAAKLRDEIMRAEQEP